MIKRLAAAAVAILLLGTGLLGWREHRRTAAAAAMAPPPPTPVALARAERRPSERGEAGVGTLEAVRQVVVSPEIGGRITAILFSSGSRVRAGQTLVRLNDAAERAEVARLRAEANLAGLSVARGEELLGGAISQAQLDQRQAELKSLRAQIDRAGAIVRQRAVLAPFSGVLGVRRVNLGQYVQPGAPLVSLTDLSSLHVNFTLPEQAWPELRRGLPIRFSVDAHPGRTFTARVMTVEPQIGTDTRAVSVQALAPNGDRALSPGMYADVRLDLPAGPSTVTVPETAVDFSSFGETVFVVRPGARGAPPTVKRVLVRTGGRSNGRVEILSGLRGGEQVVASGQINLRDGAAVTPARNTLAAVSSRTR